MKGNTLKSLALAILIIIMGACGDDAWDEMPTSISNFVSQYFPFGEIQSYTETADGSVVHIKNGATLTFDRNYSWVDVNGNGATLPVEFLYDCLPESLYDYVESIESLNDVYRVSRQSRIIAIELSDAKITYDEVTGTITYSDNA